MEERCKHCGRERRISSEYHFSESEQIYCRNLQEARAKLKFNRVEYEIIPVDKNSGGFPRCHWCGEYPELSGNKAMKVWELYATGKRRHEITQICYSCVEGMVEAWGKNS